VFRYTVRRVLLIIPTFIGASLLIFIAGFLLPGDPVSAFGGERALSPELRQVLNERYHFDEPIIQQYGNYMWNVVVNQDLGESVLRRRPVNDIFFEAFPRTMRLAVIAIAVEIVIGMLAGILAALRKDKFIDQLVLVSTTLIVSIPVFVLGFTAQTMIGVKLGWFPVAGINEGWYSYLMPAFVLAALSLAYIARLTRTSLVETMRSDYIRTAQAKGLRPMRVVGRHGLRNALIPVVTYIGIDFAFLMGGAVVTETVFSIPGVGFQLVRAIGQRDNAIVVGFTLAAVIIFLVVSLLIDLAYAWLDPRIRYE
jgi:ABC-type dipeptide/oligopeptide/nickel transport system permease component